MRLNVGNAGNVKLLFVIHSCMMREASQDTSDKVPRPQAPHCSSNQQSSQQHYCRQRFGTPNYGLKPCVARLAPDLRNLPRFFDLVPNTTLLHQPWLLPNPCRSLKASSREPIRHPEQPTSTTNASSSALYIFVLQVPCPPLPRSKPATGTLGGRTASNAIDSI